MTTLNRFNSFGKTRKGGVLALLLAVLATVIWVQLQGGSFTVPENGQIGPRSIHPKTGVVLQASLSQPMIVQGSDGTVYLDLSVVTPKNRHGEVQGIPTDMIVVLDRSGSMGEDNKWSYATQAVHSLLDRLGPTDKVALITFDSGARMESGLVWANSPNIHRLREVVNRLHPGASTNLGDALLLAENAAGSSPAAERQRRIVVLSDGHANAGIVSPAELGVIAKRIADRGSILSTIGMGLGFNETLMALVADQGMGSFSYLEHLESLGTILAKELADARDIYAQGSELRIELPSGVELVEAASYPFVLEGKTAVIRTGQLFHNSSKRFMATLRVGNQTLAEYAIGDIQLNYRVKGRTYRQQVESAGRLTIACVPAEQKEEAVASINKDLYQEAWIKNNLGSVMRQVGDYVRRGDQEKAEEVMESYRSRLEEADAAVPGVKKTGERELRALQSSVEDAFQGRDQKVKQNRAAKSFLDNSQQLQREVNRNNK